MTPTSSSIPDVFSVVPRLSCLQVPWSSLQTHPHLPEEKISSLLRIFQSILVHGCESEVYSPVQIARIDSLHCKALRHIFQVKSQDPLLLAHFGLSLLPTVPPSIKIFDQGITYFANIIRHASYPDYVVSFQRSKSLSNISSPLEEKAFRVHWTEHSLTET